jgi:hypothetical protein
MGLNTSVGMLLPSKSGIGSVRSMDFGPISKWIWLDWISLDMDLNRILCPTILDGLGLQ